AVDGPPLVTFGGSDCLRYPPAMVSAPPTMATNRPKLGPAETPKLLSPPRDELPSTQKRMAPSTSRPPRIMNSIPSLTPQWGSFICSLKGPRRSQRPRTRSQATKDSRPQRWKPSTESLRLRYDSLYQGRNIAISTTNDPPRIALSPLVRSSMKFPAVLSGIGFPRWLLVMRFRPSPARSCPDSAEWYARPATASMRGERVPSGGP